MKPIISGIITVIMRCWAGSMPACGVIFCTRNMLTTMTIGSTKGNDSGPDRSWIQNQCAWRRSMALLNMR